jgi:hypothetical protein
MEMKRYKLEVSNENADKVIESIEREFRHKISHLRKRIDAVIRGETYVNFSTDEDTIVGIVKASDGLYNQVVCLTDKYPELNAFRKATKKA